MFPTCVSVPVTTVSAREVMPLTVKSLSISTSLLGTSITPAPFALNSRLLLLSVVVIRLPAISISPLLMISASKS